MSKLTLKIPSGKTFWLQHISQIEVISFFKVNLKFYKYENTGKMILSKQKETKFRLRDQEGQYSPRNVLSRTQKFKQI
jgi:hypothetical protein